MPAGRHVVEIGVSVRPRRRDGALVMGGAGEPIERRAIGLVAPDAATPGERRESLGGAAWRRVQAIDGHVRTQQPLDRIHAVDDERSVDCPVAPHPLQRPTR